jgi:LEA14-like dessication related protein
MIKKHTLLLILLVSVSCTIKQKPTFIKVENIKLINANSNKITLSAEALFNNPNAVGGRINTDGVKVYVNDISFGEIETEEFKVPAKNDFKVPLKLQIKTKDLLDKDPNGFLNGLLNSVLNRSLKVRFEGSIQFKTLGINHSYPIDKTETLKIKL